MSRSLRPIAGLLSVLLLANAPAQAAPVTFADVIQVIGGSQNPPQLWINNVRQQQDSATQKSGTPQPANGTNEIFDPMASTTTLLTGVAFEMPSPQDPVNTDLQGDIEGTVCDCGVVTLASDFPKWPLLFLAAVPLFFIEDDDCDDCVKVTPTPTPVPNPTPTPQTPIPEPASLLLFGSGIAALGARLRRRRTNAKREMASELTKEG
jgi:hypothetical protein